jgi:hypothetical protein
MKVRGFVHALKALESRLGEVVLAGGWAWYLYRKYLTGGWQLPGEFTLDVDLVVPRHLSSSGARLDQILEAADFELEMEGEERPPVSKHYWPSTDEPEAVVEFLTPARASGNAATLEVSGIVAQQLRFLDLLLDAPLEIEVDESGDGESFAGKVRVPRVGPFVFQKALTFVSRQDRGKRYKDLFYIFDIADETRSLQQAITRDVRGYSERLEVAWLAEAATNLERDCGAPESDSIGRILDQIPTEQRPPRKYVADTFSRLVQIFKQNTRSGG